MADSVVVEPAQILDDVFFHVVHFGPHLGAMIETTEEIRKRSTGMGQADFELRIAIHDPAED